jgi:hypothetical protein
MATEISAPTAFTAFTASTTTVIFTIVVVVIDVTVIVVITTMNNLSELAMKRSCVEALPGVVRYLHFKHARLWSVASEWAVRMIAASAQGTIFEFFLMTARP